MLGAEGVVCGGRGGAFPFNWAFTNSKIFNRNKIRASGVRVTDIEASNRQFAVTKNALGSGTT